jgi:sugar phosphate isomerase/epimerase
LHQGFFFQEVPGVNLMICIRGEPEQVPFLPEIEALGVGIELGSYGLMGIRSQRDWEERFALHKAIIARFRGAIAVHGPFLGMEVTHPDHLIREAVGRRLDMSFDVAVELGAGRIVLHSGYKPEIELFCQEESWVSECAEFWKREIRRWADAGVAVALENDTQKTPDLLVRLVEEVDDPSLGLCMDIGHQHRFSGQDPLEWVRRMGDWLVHVHLHDNDRTGDHHWPIGRGTVDFEPFYAAVERQVPGATLSLEVEDAMEVKMGDLRRLATRFAPAPACRGDAERMRDRRPR